MVEREDAGAGTPDRPGVSPVGGGARISSLDTLRGLALLGILAMNIQFFALSAFAWFKPPLAGGFEGVDYAAWLASHLLFDQKMMSIFSMLFGAGIVLFAEKAIAKRGRAWWLHVRRMWWLWVIGMVHAYVFWEGDILVAYAVCGLIAYPLRRIRPGWLVLIAVVVLTIGPVIGTAQGFLFKLTSDAAAERAALVERGEPVPDEIANLAEVWEGTYDEETGELLQDGIAAGFEPTPEQLEAELDAIRGTFTDRMAFRSMDVVFFQTYVFAIWGVWRVVGMMALGMALFKWGVLSAERSGAFYAGLALVGFGLGLPLVGLGAWLMERAGYGAVSLFLYTGHPNYVGSILVALGWISLVMLACRSGTLPRVRTGLAAVGRMAFTNYLGQTLICSLIFFGWGLGNYGRLSRAELVPVFVAIWAAQIAFSVWWLGRFRFGPMEWAWRSLTYWRRQPIRRERAAGGGEGPA